MQQAFAGRLPQEDRPGFSGAGHAVSRAAEKPAEKCAASSEVLYACGFHNAAVHDDYGLPYESGFHRESNPLCVAVPVLTSSLLLAPGLLLAPSLLLASGPHCESSLHREAGLRCVTAPESDPTSTAYTPRKQQAPVLPPRQNTPGNGGHANRPRRISGLTILLPLLLCLLAAGCTKRVGPYVPKKTTPSTGAKSAPATKYSKGNLPAVVHTVRAQLGTPYEWGGCSPREGFDCSGLIRWAYLRHGVELPRVSWEQIRAGRRIGWSELRPGDLIFFKTDRTIRGYHVGVISLPGRFVHSPKSGGRVMESPLANPYWQDHFVMGRRVLP